jgi:Protein of unknown function (DUF726)
MLRKAFSIMEKLSVKMSRQERVAIVLFLAYVHSRDLLPTDQVNHCLKYEALKLGFQSFVDIEQLIHCASYLKNADVIMAKIYTRDSKYELLNYLLRFSMSYRYSAINRVEILKIARKLSISLFELEKIEAQIFSALQSPLTVPSVNIFYRLQINTGGFQPVYLGGESVHAYVGVGGFLSQDYVFKNVISRAFKRNYPHSTQYIIQWHGKSSIDLLKLLVLMSFIPTVVYFLSQFYPEPLIERLSMFFLLAIILSIIAIVKNPWAKACRNADSAGKTLGRYLQARGFGAKSVTLVGYSLGVRVILNALKYLSDENEIGLVDDVYLLAGAASTESKWLHYNLHRVVAGNIINVYSRQDFVLKYLYRMISSFKKPIGMTPLRKLGIVDLDFTDTAGGHFTYLAKMSNILLKIQK